jgi:hypothetical protein
MHYLLLLHCRFIVTIYHDTGCSLEVLKKLVDNASENNNHVNGILADGMYDSNKNFRYLSKNHIKPLNLV